MISKAMEPFLAGSSQIRAMFEEGKKMAKIYGAENCRRGKAPLLSKSLKRPPKK